VKPFRISHPASAEFAEAVRWYEQKRIASAVSPSTL